MALPRNAKKFGGGAEKEQEIVGSLIVVRGGMGYRRSEVWERMRESADEQVFIPIQSMMAGSYFAETDASNHALEGMLTEITIGNSQVLMHVNEKDHVTSDLVRRKFEKNTVVPVV